MLSHTSGLSNTSRSNRPKKLIGYSCCFVGKFLQLLLSAPPTKKKKILPQRPGWRPDVPLEVIVSEPPHVSPQNPQQSSERDGDQGDVCPPVYPSDRLNQSCSVFLFPQLVRGSDLGHLLLKPCVKHTQRKSDGESPSLPVKCCYSK